ncbi:hypothetical protein GGR53DRAFT_13188 [Hypoxylon sp. FL1150]|nr:hypothetical protein GGR53DRAFT_13188 [Hypoxylon sp. FL1150]
MYCARLLIVPSTMLFAPHGNTYLTYGVECRQADHRNLLAFLSYKPRAFRKPYEADSSSLRSGLIGYGIFKPYPTSSFLPRPPLVIKEHNTARIVRILAGYAHQSPPPHRFCSVLQED